MKREIVTTVARWKALLKFFPGDEASAEIVMEFLAELVSTPEELRWLSDTMVDEIGEWPGAKEVRGLFCSRFAPRDGIEAECTLPTIPRQEGLPGASQRQIEASGGHLAIAGSVQEPVQPLEPGELETAWRDAVSKMEQKAGRPNRDDRRAADEFARRIGWLPAKRETIQ
jgi:hypothetical protein